MYVAIYCTSAEQATLVELFFPVRAGERVEGIVHMPCVDDVAQYCVRIGLNRPVMSIQQRASLLGWCSWYAYRGTPERLLGSAVDLDSLETFATWLAFQEDSVERTWSTVFQDYARVVAVSEVSAMKWLYGHPETAVSYSDTLPEWVSTLSEFLAHEQEHTITKVSLQQLIEAVEDRRDICKYQIG